MPKKGPNNNAQEERGMKRMRNIGGRVIMGIFTQCTLIPRIQYQTICLNWPTIYLRWAYAKNCLNSLRSKGNRVGML